ncbi:DUF1516 family protein [Lactiplantibacillus sp. WILCCON 0030]|uniref:DUF1516 family protein n=1 Tax=Lactiplantibacillus brownii TaxID=3069269 RepID=A0ABU1A854_9LACO|nr:DUF1516 family protein [Lactiplantibacillus brownii]MDQ7937142.1 DUF1516 family protein [Lactiplantibacillus brownii]
MILSIHLGSWLWLFVMVALGLTRHSVKATNRYLILSRLGYLLLIVSGVYLSTKTFSTAWLLTGLKGVLGIGSIGLIEVAFARKQESRLSPQLLALLIAGLILTVICGVSLHYLLSGHLI